VNVHVPRTRVPARQHGSRTVRNRAGVQRADRPLLSFT
jgi:hypothetical protein